MDSKDEKSLHLLCSPHIGGQKMSSSLKERLKRSSRSFSSPILRSADVFPVQITNDISSNIKECSDIQNAESLTLMSPITLEDIESCTDQELLQKMHSELKSEISNKEEKLRKLDLVERYNLKNKPDDLVHLIQKWLTALQESLRKLHEKLPENGGDFSTLLKILNIDNDIIQYDPESDTFY